MFENIKNVQSSLRKHQYVANRGLSTVIYLSSKLQKPLFLEGEPGVGKTEVAKVLASIKNTRLIRLQCYEGLDIHNAVYDWAYSRQILHLRILEANKANKEEMERELYSRDFLMARPLLKAIEDNADQVPVLLIDEIDRADEEFESFLLEILSDFQITIPEIGTIKAAKPPFVVITSNRTREVHDALKRRCLYHWIDYPDFSTEYEIVQIKVPGIGEKLTRQLVTTVQELRQAELYKPPGIAETLDWANALLAMDAQVLDEEMLNDTLGVLLKHQDDIQKIQGEMVQTIVRQSNAAI
ncbi:MAG TPA: ATPase [Chloroflexi bacterium]|nr:ATPase [Chloroflexota bacterium]